MDAGLTLLTLLHLLIPIYWLGGDLGTFLCGRAVRNAALSPAERLFALRMLLAIDMAPRTALILAFPTGFTLAQAKGWLIAAPVTVAAAWLAALVWLAIAWTVHLRHGPAGERFRRIDIAIRYAVLAGLTAAALAGLAGALAMPLFVAIKLLLLAGAIITGIVVRHQLAPLFPAIAALRSEGASGPTDAAISAVLKRTQATVLCIWAVVLAASATGIAVPV